MRLIETDSLSNQNISSALEIGSYTADAARALLVRVFADAVAGDGDYTVYATIQLAGAGSAYRMIPITEAAAASGLTAIAFPSVTIPVSSGDIVKVYIDGLAGDTTTPDTRVEWWELSYLKPATADRTIVVDASGQVTTGAFAAGAITAAAIATGAIDADALAADAVDEILDELIGDSTITMRQALKILVSTLAGKASGGGTTAVVFRNVADDDDVVTATVDVSGNRTAVTLSV